jgi:cytidylate kinase
MPIVAVTREMGSPGTAIATEVARRLGHEFLRDDLVARVVREYRVREAGEVVGAVEQTPGLMERLRGPRRRYRTYLEAAVLDAARRERVVLVGRWSTLFLRGIPHAIRVRVCEPVPARVHRVMERLRVDRPEAERRVAAYDEGVRTRMREMFDAEWADPLLYDLALNTERMSVETAVRQVLALAEAAEYQPTLASRALLEDRALAARVRATLKSSPATARAHVDARAADGRVTLAGVVSSDEERERVMAAARGVPGVADAVSELKVFRRPIR